MASAGVLAVAVPASSAMEQAPCAVMSSKPAGAHLLEKQPGRVMVWMRVDKDQRHGTHSAESRAQSLLAKVLFPDAGEQRIVLKRSEIEVHECDGFGVVTASIDPQFASLGRR